MKIEHVRSANVRNGEREYCISHIYVDGTYFCDAIEDYDRGLDLSMTLAEIKRKKIYGETAIPTGQYTVKMNQRSPTFAQKSYYKSFCNGMLPRLDPVKGYYGILIHRGKDERSSAGCIIVGYNKVRGQVVDSQKAFETLYTLLKDASEKNEAIDYIITRKYRL